MCHVARRIGAASQDHYTACRQGGSMSTKSLLPALAATLLGSATPALAQDLPDGPGKETVAAVCGGCHDINRIRAGYSAAGWKTVMQMMHNMEAPVPNDQVETV